MPDLTITVRIMKHVIRPGDKYGRLTVIAEVQKAAADGRRYRAARQAPHPSYDVWHHRVNKARGPASGYACADCGNPAQDWSTVNPSSDDIQVRFQPRCRRCHRHYDGAVGEGNRRAKLTSRKVRQLRARRADGLTYRQLAAEFGVSDVSACAAVNRKTWAHVS